MYTLIFVKDPGITKYDNRISFLDIGSKRDQCYSIRQCLHGVPGTNARRFDM